MISKRYFYLQKITFAAVGIDVAAKTPKQLIKYPPLLYGLIFVTCFHLMLVAHHAFENLKDFEEITHSIPLLCEQILCVSKMLILVRRRKEILYLIRKIHELNLKANYEELEIVRHENARDYSLCSWYVTFVIFTGGSSIVHPILNAIYIYFTRDKVVLDPPNKATYFWNHAHLSGYIWVYILNTLSLYYICAALNIDMLFSWLISNMSAQFHIIRNRFKRSAHKCSRNISQQRCIKSIIRYHCQMLKLMDKLKYVYGEIIILEFTIVCVEICSLVFRVTRPNDSAGDVIYKCLFFAAVAFQLMLYCYNGQRIEDESSQIATVIYCTFDWANLSTTYRKLLLLPIMCSQKSVIIKCAFFKLDLTLYLWVFKTAWSLLTALKTMHENNNEEN